MDSAEKEALVLFREAAMQVRVVRAQPVERPFLERASLPELKVLGEQLQEMTELLRAISTTLSKSARAQKPSKLLSLRQAARLLGIDRNITLHELISSGQLTTVTVNGRVRIPAEEVERLCREGFDSSRQTRRPKRPVPKALPENLGAKIRSLKL